MALQLKNLPPPVGPRFWLQRIEHFKRYAGLVKRAQFTDRLRFLDINAVERWKRVEACNDNQGVIFHIKMTRDMFDYNETIWEPPSTGEMTSISTIG